MAWDRNERTEALLKEKIAIIVLERLNDPRLGFVTITGVKLSRDKRHAKVLYTVLGNATQRRTTERALRDAAPHVQEQLAPAMRMRSMPELRFTYDESVAKESRMLELLDELASKRGDGPAGEPLGAAEDDEPEPVEGFDDEAGDDDGPGPEPGDDEDDAVDDDDEDARR